MSIWKTCSSGWNGKAIHRYVVDFNRKPDSLLFATPEGTPVRRMTALRGMKFLCEHLGFVPPRPHPPEFQAYICGELSPARRVRVPSSEGLGSQLGILPKAISDFL
jgi:hypothetical protein